MKKFYFYSKKRLEFTEIKNYKLKFFFVSLGIFVFSSVLISVGIMLYNELFNTSSSIYALKKENDFLKNKVGEFADKFSKLSLELDKITSTNNDLRIASNLPPISDEERKVGIGGGDFKNILHFITSQNREELEKALSFVDEIDRKFSFEKNNYYEISNTLTENKKLFKSLPAIKPCNGTLALHGFGMRYHPILNVRRMHEGIDIICDRGTKVISPGDGVVSFVGVRGGLGLTVEIDHGFGYTTIYGHLSRTLVKEGKSVSRGTQIAMSGNTGLSTGPHLHYEVLHNGVNKNPLEFFFDDLYLFN